METSEFLNNPNYQVYVGQTLALHTLIAQGQGDSEQAEVLRDEMSEPWNRLSSREKTRLRGLSADLYMLTGEEIFQQVDPLERTRERFEPCLRAAWKQRDWDKVLSLLRTGPAYLSADELAYLRGRCWTELGHPVIALLFFDHAARLNPQNINYRVVTLEPLLQLGQLDEARQRAHCLGVDAEAHLVQLM